jgi:putative colanic acid biosynthesis UDP-glucose lipid carrier transferase
MDIAPCGRMFASPSEQRLVNLRARLSSTRAIESLLDPLVIVCSLVVVAEPLNAGFGKPLLIVAFIAFSVNFPGRPFLSVRDRLPTGRVFIDWALFAGMLLAFGYATQYIRFFAINVVILWLVLTPIALVSARAAVTQLLSKLFTIEARMRTAVIVGCNSAGMRLAVNLRSYPFTGIRLIGFFDDRDFSRLHGIEAQELLGKFAQIRQFVRITHVDQIYLALPMASQPRVMKILDDLRDTTASIFFIPDIFVTNLIQGRVDDVAGLPVFTVRDTPLRGVSGLIKRLLDVTLATCLLIVSSPLLLFTALAVKLSSPGPVIFKQCRYGLDGRPIMVYKFRTMTVTEDGEKNYTQVIRDDPRVTRIGARLRQLSLDELPQLLNVLTGEMSLVGPRPHAVAVNEQYRRLIPDYMVRHKVRPGITGWAQVNGYRGGDDLESMQKRIDYDLEYLRGWSVGLDILILIRTLRVLIGKDAKAF